MPGTSPGVGGGRAQVFAPTSCRVLFVIVSFQVSCPVLRPSVAVCGGSARARNLPLPVSVPICEDCGPRKAQVPASNAVTGP